jgi:hypothetical protein
MSIPDFESKILLDIAPKVAFHPEERAKLERHIRERAEMVRTGVERCPAWFQEELNSLDPRLRAWWNCWTEQWVIDRLQDEGVVERMERVAREEGDHDTAQGLRESATGLLADGAYYLTVLRFTPSPTLQLDRQLIAMLRSCDMQRFESPQEYVARKREAAEKVEARNERASMDQVMGAVDQMSTKQLENFIAVEEARASGETITARGEDAKFLERAAEERRKALAQAEARGEILSLDIGDRAINPGMHPQRYRRKRAKRERGSA